METIVSVVTLRDLLSAVARGEPLRLPSLLRPALFVPETVRISHLLRQLQQTRQGVAMVADEYGSVVGLATVEDVVEEIVGEIGERDRASGRAHHQAARWLRDAGWNDSA